MCGNFALYSSVAAIKEYYKLLQETGEIEPKENIRPSQQVPVIVIKQGKRYLGFVRWGLIPFWAKDDKIGYKLFNARAETIEVKTSFKNSFKSKRCLIPANGFFEWRKPDKAKFYFKLRSRELFSFAGLWEAWKNPDGAIIPSCTIITTAPNEVVAKVHDRMPVILRQEDEATWLESDDPEILKNLLQAYPAEDMVILQK
ncbi:MAG: SOS response-associated peptidase [Candidatus Cloacimonetes bacterium]|nr:SOS response-associated peptidase [Candidatus Cloacimonadota bacterium]